MNLDTATIGTRTHKYNISSDGDFDETDDWDSDSGEFYCNDCYIDNVG